MRAVAPARAAPPCAPLRARRCGACVAPPVARRRCRASALPQAWDQVPRVAAGALSEEELALRCAAGTPLLVSGAWPDLDPQAWLARLVSQLGSRRVVYQVQRSGVTELFEDELRGYLGEMVSESSHDAARFLFDEHALSGAPALRLSAPAWAVGADGDAFESGALCH